MAVALLSKGQELLNYLRPFRIGSGRLPQAGELKAIECLIRDLEKRNPTPEIKTAFERVAGTWECVFTNSRFVLGLDNLPFLHTSAVYQQVIVHPGKKAGHYFNIAELSCGNTVKCVCGEYAGIRPSEFHPTRLDVQYEWFYFGWRFRLPYEGHGMLADELEASRLPKHLRLPFHACGWQATSYLDDELRIVQGSQGGLFVLVKCH
jgi:PAP_fibrillin